MRKIEKIYKMHETLEGAGVHLKRGFSYAEAQAFDPFLLFDDFSNTEADAYRAGFPQHPHRGMETVTYLLKGEVKHRDSLGNEGSITAGDVQWMTAGSGIVHEEMPVVHEGGIRGFQLWVNLPAKDKMMTPRYQEIKASEIPVVETPEATVRVIAGEYEDVEGPVQDLMVSPTYFDVTLNARMQTTFSTLAEDNFFAYVIGGRLGVRDDRSEDWVGEGELVHFTHDTKLMCTGGKDGVRFLLIGGKPLREPVVGHGPIVMNTEAEIQQAFADMQDGTFVK
jgi:redox-sensitive bicupin YhaK (pirin superfamily)